MSRLNICSKRTRYVFPVHCVQAPLKNQCLQNMCCQRNESVLVASIGVLFPCLCSFTTNVEKRGDPDYHCETAQAQPSGSHGDWRLTFRCSELSFQRDASGSKKWWKQFFDIFKCGQKKPHALRSSCAFNVTLLRSRAEQVIVTIGISEMCLILCLWSIYELDRII